MVRYHRCQSFTLQKKLQSGRQQLLCDRRKIWRGCVCVCVCFIRPQTKVVLLTLTLPAVCILHSPVNSSKMRAKLLHLLSYVLLALAKLPLRQAAH